MKKINTDSTKLREILSMEKPREIDQYMRRPVELYLSLTDLKLLMSMTQDQYLTAQMAQAYVTLYKKSHGHDL